MANDDNTSTLESLLSITGVCVLTYLSGSFTSRILYASTHDTSDPAYGTKINKAAKLGGVALLGLGIAGFFLDQRRRKEREALLR